MTQRPMDDLDGLLRGGRDHSRVDSRLRLLLRGWRNELVQHPDERTAASHLAMIKEAARAAAHDSVITRPSWRARLGRIMAATTIKIAVGATAAAAATGGLAAAGRLPEPAQELVAGVVEPLGVDLPRPERIARDAIAAPATAPEEPTAEARTADAPEPDPGRSVAALDGPSSGPLEGDGTPTESQPPTSPSPTQSSENTIALPSDVGEGSPSTGACPSPSPSDEPSSSPSDEPEPEPSTSHAPPVEGDDDVEAQDQQAEPSASPSGSPSEESSQAPPTEEPSSSPSPSEDDDPCDDPSSSPSASESDETQNHGPDPSEEPSPEPSGDDPSGTEPSPAPSGSGSGTDGSSPSPAPSSSPTPAPSPAADLATPTGGAT